MHIFKINLKAVKIDFKKFSGNYSGSYIKSMLW